MDEFLSNSSQCKVCKDFAFPRGVGDIILCWLIFTAHVICSFLFLVFQFWLSKFADETINIIFETHTSYLFEESLDR